MNVPAFIFRAYDVRGIYPDDLNEKVIEHIGKAFGTYLRRNGLHECVTGRDIRDSSPSLSTAFIRGVISTGCNITDVGLTLMPLIHFYTCTAGFDAGGIVTASHNPKNYNGIKLELKNAVPFAGDTLAGLIEVISKEDYETGQGTVTFKDLTDNYVDYMLSHFHFSDNIKNIKVVLDCGGGVTGLAATKIFEKIGCQLIKEETVLDPTFAKGIPDPEDLDFMSKVKKYITDEKADIGFGFDADGDRLGVADSDGYIYKNDEILLFLASDFLARYPGKEVVYDIKSSEVVGPEIEKMGGTPKMIRTGRSFFLQEMKKGAVLGSELSGHTYIGGDYFGFDDGIFTALTILRILDERGKSLSKLMSSYPRTANTPEIKIPVKEADKSSVLYKIKKLAESTGDFTKFITVDGIRAYISPTGWFLVRSSNTSAYLSVRLEGKDTQELEKVKEKLEKILSQIKI